jgi:hypothetical protein
MGGPFDMKGASYFGRLLEIVDLGVNLKFESSGPIVTET